MLKGILFVIAIIITFDIGVALIDSWQADEKEPLPVEQSDKAIEKEIEQSNKDIKEVHTNSESTLIDLSLPPEVDVESDSSDTLLQNNNSLFNPSSLGDTTKEKKVSLSAKPIVSFDQEVDKKPNLEGASVGLKIQLD